RLLGARRRRAGVTEDAGPVFERLVARGNGVAQAVLLAHLREQPGAHAAVQHVDRPNRVVILGVAERHARIGDANLRLGSFLADVTIAALRLADPKRRLGTGLPVVEQPADLLLERLPGDVAGHRQDGAVRPEEPAVVGAEDLDVESLDALL